MSDTQRIIISTCFGGFSFSTAAALELVRRNAACVQRKTFAEYTGGKTWETYQWIGGEPVPIGDGFKAHEHLVSDVLYKDGHVYMIDDSAARTDPTALAVVEELGERANGMCAELRIVEIPAGVEWEIDEYDGSETIDEKHRSWR